MVGGSAGTSGGRALNGSSNVYQLSTTLKVPAAQDFRIQGGESVINYNQASGDAMTIDSCEDCHFQFGLVVTGATSGSNAAVAFRPTNPTNLDNLKVITDSTFDFSSIAASAATPAYAINLDATNGPILWNDFNVTATVGFQTNVRLYSPSASNAVTNNGFRIIHNHQATTTRPQPPWCPSVPTPSETGGY